VALANEAADAEATIIGGPIKIVASRNGDGEYYLADRLPGSVAARDLGVWYRPAAVVVAGNRASNQGGRIWARGSGAFNGVGASARP